MRKLLLALTAGAATTVGFAGAPVLAAGHGPVNAVTHTSDHPDTTSVSGPCTVDSPGGPVWAYDNLSLRFHVVPEDAADTYSVTIYGNGSFDAIADPHTGACSTGRGSIDGWLQFDVYSSTAPDPASLPPQEPSDMSQTQMLSQLFDNNSAIVGGGHYSYTYNRIDGSKYVQNG